MKADRRPSRHISCLPLALCLATQALLLSPVPALPQEPVAGARQVLSEQGEKNLALLREVWELVGERFYDPGFNGVDWGLAFDRYAPGARTANGEAELVAVINTMLGELDTSHTYLFGRSDPRYYQLLDVFSHLGREVFDGGEVRYAETGIVAATIDGKVYVTGIIDGMPAASTGLLIGDEIVAVNGRPFVPEQCTGPEPGPPMQVRIRRAPAAGTELITVEQELVRPRDMYLRAMSESVSVTEHDGLHIGHVHVWSYAGQHYQERLLELVNQEPLRDADALVLDIRDGWGGASPAYLNLFNRRLPLMTMQRRGEEPFPLDRQWRKPVVLLVNQGSRSGKEIIAYGFRAYDVGPVVGTTTGGDVTGGSAFLLSDGSLLYLAVADVQVDGKRLEGIGVEPDIQVPFDCRYAAGADPQRDRAIAVAAHEVRKQEHHCR
jgi:carboxyl-terminal processing protease